MGIIILATGRFGTYLLCVLRQPGHKGSKTAVLGAHINMYTAVCRMNPHSHLWVDLQIVSWTTLLFSLCTLVVKVGKGDPFWAAL